jgi:hypothetical protein
MKLKAVGFVLVATLAMVAPSNALEQPVVNDGDLMACKNIGDFIKVATLANQEIAASIRFFSAKEAVGACYTIPKGAKVYSMDGLPLPSRPAYECLRVEGETECAWSMPIVWMAETRRKLGSSRP